MPEKMGNITLTHYVQDFPLHKYPIITQASVRNASILYLFTNFPFQNATSKNRICIFLDQYLRMYVLINAWQIVKLELNNGALHQLRQLMKLCCWPRPAWHCTFGWRLHELCDKRMSILHKGLYHAEGGIKLEAIIRHSGITKIKIALHPTSRHSHFPTSVPGGNEKKETCQNSPSRC